ncbi:MAG: hypothetical protein KKB51_02890 [Candidatus Riflebacteria bacterium]|nr:hypothetical protein [Candidatus Riflebacteria bacterium]
MLKSFVKYRNRFLEATLEALWQQWSELGIAGHSSGRSSFVVDPEALILVTCFFGRYDQRLFDEMISWLRRNERFINIQRLRTISKKHGFAAFNLLGPISCYLTASSPTPKWKAVQIQCRHELEHLKPHKFFMMQDNRSIPVLGETDTIFSEFNLLRLPFQDKELTGKFPVGSIASMQLQLRALFGVNSRAEVILYLLLHDSATIQEISTFSCYSWRSIQETLFELAHSGFVSHPEAKKGRKYRMNHEQWSQIFPIVEKKQLAYVGQVNLFRSLELIWLKISDEKVTQLSSDGLNIEMKELFRQEINPRLACDEGNLPHFNPDYSDLSGFFESAMAGMIKILAHFA